MRTSENRTTEIRRSQGPGVFLLTLLDLSGKQLVHPGMDMACIPSIFIKTSQFFLMKAV